MPIRYALRTTTHKLVRRPKRPEWTDAFDLVSDNELTAKPEAELTAMTGVHRVNTSTQRDDAATAL